jgi:hypothetical protein
MTNRATTSKPASTNAKIVEAVTLHAVGAPQKPGKYGPLEVTQSGLVLHLPADLFANPAKKSKLK